MLLFLTFNLSVFSQTQLEMNNEANNKYKKADAKLNSIYQRVLDEYKLDTLFVDQLKKSQRIWIEFRNAELELKYPAENKQIEYGSTHPMCVALYLKELTEIRTKRLKIWINGTEQGDLCAGSVKRVSEVYIDMNYIQKATIEKDSTIWLKSNMKLDHRIFGYKRPNINSQKMILLSIFTGDVKDNRFNCKYGAYYETSEMKNMKLKYILTEGDFHKIKIIKDEQVVDEIFMEKEWFEFNK